MYRVYRDGGLYFSAYVHARAIEVAIVSVDQFFLKSLKGARTAFCA